MKTVQLYIDGRMFVWKESLGRVEETQSELAPLTHRSPPHLYSHCRLILSAGEKHCSAAAVSLHWTWRPAPAADSVHLSVDKFNILLRRIL